MSRYDAVAQQIVNTSNPPFGITVSVVEYPDDPPGALYLRIYVREYYDFKKSRVQHITDWLNALVKKLNNHPLVLGTYSIEVSEEEPR